MLSEVGQTLFIFSFITFTFRDDTLPPLLLCCNRARLNSPRLPRSLLFTKESKPCCCLHIVMSMTGSAEWSWGGIISLQSGPSDQENTAGGMEVHTGFVLTNENEWQYMRCRAVSLPGLASFVSRSGSGSCKPAVSLSRCNVFGNQSADANVAIKKGVLSNPEPDIPSELRCDELLWRDDWITSCLSFDLFLSAGFAEYWHIPAGPRQ